MRHLVISDYDRTLFDSGRYERAIRQILHDEFHLDPVAFGKEIHARTDAGGYDLFAHLADHNISASTAHSIITDTLGAESFLYPDAVHFLRQMSALPEIDLAVVTVGSPAYQQLKLEYLQQAAPHIPARVVGINKGTWLETSWLRRELHPLGRHIEFEGTPYSKVAVVDDKTDTFAAMTPAPHILMVHLLRPDAKYQDTIDAPTITQDLAAAASLIAGWMAE